MVDVTDKPITTRAAVAKGWIRINKLAYDLITDPRSAQIAAKDAGGSTSEAVTRALSKGPVLETARLAGIQAAKRTSDLIPLCHPLALTHVKVALRLANKSPAVKCVAMVRSVGRTGVEMEALTAVTVSLLTVWDMLKAVAGQDMHINNVHVSSKFGGRSGNFRKNFDGSTAHLDPILAPAEDDEELPEVVAGVDMGITNAAVDLKRPGKSGNLRKNIDPPWTNPEAVLDWEEDDEELEIMSDPRDAGRAGVTSLQEQLRKAAAASASPENREMP